MTSVLAVIPARGGSKGVPPVVREVTDVVLLVQCTCPFLVRRDADGGCGVDHAKSFRPRHRDRPQDLLEIDDPHDLARARALAPLLDAPLPPSPQPTRSAPAMSANSRLRRPGSRTAGPGRPVHVRGAIGIDHDGEPANTFQLIDAAEASLGSRSGVARVVAQADGGHDAVRKAKSC